MFVIRTGNFTKCLLEDPDQTAFLQSDLGLHCLSRLFWLATSVQNLRTFYPIQTKIIRKTFWVLFSLFC